MVTGQKQAGFRTRKNFKLLNLGVTPGTFLTPHGLNKQRAVKLQQVGGDKSISPSGNPDNIIHKSSRNKKIIYADY